MTPGSVARRYARALYELAREERQVDETAERLSAVAEAVVELDVETIGEGVLDAEVRRRIGRALANEVGANSTLGRFLMVVAENDRLVRIPAVHEWYTRLQDAAAGRVRLAITTAAPLADDAVGAIRKTFEAIARRDVVAQVRTDAALIGGAVAELEGRVYDGSVKTRLARLGARMAGNGAARQKD